jgi:mannosyltransferase OCH1-like enzyme
VFFYFFLSGGENQSRRFHFCSFLLYFFAMDQLGRQLTTLTAFCESNPPTWNTLLGLANVAKGWQTNQMYHALVGKWQVQQQQQQQQQQQRSHELRLAPIRVPRIIWLYWETLPGRTKPAYLDACLESMRAWSTAAAAAHPPTMRIIVVCPENIHEYLDDLHPMWQRFDKVEQKADYVRVLLLARHGGVWMDMDTICFGSIVPFLERLEHERRDLVLWQRDVSYEMNNALIVVVPQHPIMVDALTRMHARFDQVAVSNNERLHFDNWTELGSTLYGECVHAHLMRQHELCDAGPPLRTCIELRSMADIEPFSWVDAREWTVSRSHQDTDAWLMQHVRQKETRTNTMMPVLSFPNALIEPAYKTRFASVDELLASAHHDPHYLSAALACAMRSPSERDAVRQTILAKIADTASQSNHSPPQCHVM